MYPDYTPTAPHGSPQAGPGRLGESVNSSGDAVVENDVLLFEFENKKEGDQSEVWIDCYDTIGGNRLATGALNWQQGETGTRYVQFVDFPAPPDGFVMHSCYYQVTLREGTNVWMTVYRG